MKNKELSLKIFNSIRKEIPPPTVWYKNKKDKRIHKFDYKKQLDEY